MWGKGESDSPDNTESNDNNYCFSHVLTCQIRPNAAEIRILLQSTSVEAKLWGSVLAELFILYWSKVTVCNISWLGTVNCMWQLLLGSNITWHLVKHRPATDTYHRALHPIPAAGITAAALSSCILHDQDISAKLLTAVEFHRCNSYSALSAYAATTIAQLLRWHSFVHCDGKRQQIALSSFSPTLLHLNCICTGTLFHRHHSPAAGVSGHRITRSETSRYDWTLNI